MQNSTLVRYWDGPFILIIEEPYKSLTACVFIDFEESQSRYYEISQSVISSTGEKFSDDPLALRMRAFPVLTNPLDINYRCSCGTIREPIIQCTVCDA